MGAAPSAMSGGVDPLDAYMSSLEGDAVPQAAEPPLLHAPVDIDAVLDPALVASVVRSVRGHPRFVIAPGTSRYVAPPPPPDPSAAVSSGYAEVGGSGGSGGSGDVEEGRLLAGLSAHLCANLPSFFGALSFMWYCPCLCVPPPSGCFRLVVWLRFSTLSISSLPRCSE